MFKLIKDRSFYHRKGEKLHTINVEIPSDLHAVLEMHAAHLGISKSDVCRQIVEQGRKCLPFYDEEKTEVRNLTFWVSEAQYQSLRTHAKKQDAFFKSMLLYWFVSCLKDVEYAGHDGRSDSDQSVG